MIIVGAFEITFFFSDGAPTAALAAFNAVTVGIGADQLHDFGRGPRQAD